LVEVAKWLGRYRDINKSDLVLHLSNGAEIMCRSAKEPEDLRGPNISGAWIDEASQIKRAAYDIVLACLRQGGKMGWLSATFTPKGRLHWTYEVFGKGEPNTELIQARTRDNPFLPAEFYDTIKGQYTTLFAAQELEGAFIETSGTLFQRHWFPVVRAAPVDLVRRVRYWDLAASEPKKGRDPDYTAGCLMGRSREGAFYILDMRRLRATPQAVENLIKQTAALDGTATHIWMEREPGASGINLIYHYLQVLAGYTFAPMSSLETRWPEPRRQSLRCAPVGKILGVVHPQVKEVVQRCFRGRSDERLVRIGVGRQGREHAVLPTRGRCVRGGRRSGGPGRQRLLEVRYRLNGCSVSLLRGAGRLGVGEQLAALDGPPGG
jgi:hypothetical protein